MIFRIRSFTKVNRAALYWANLGCFLLLLGLDALRAKYAPFPIRYQGKGESLLYLINLTEIALGAYLLMEAALSHFLKKQRKMPSGMPAYPTPARLCAPQPEVALKNNPEGWFDLPQK